MEEHVCGVSTTLTALWRPTSARPMSITVTFTWAPSALLTSVNWTWAKCKPVLHEHGSSARMLVPWGCFFISHVTFSSTNPFCTLSHNPLLNLSPSCTLMQIFGFDTAFRFLFCMSHVTILILPFYVEWCTYINMPADASLLYLKKVTFLYLFCSYDRWCTVFALWFLLFALNSPLALKIELLSYLKTLQQEYQCRWQLVKFITSSCKTEM